MPEDRLTPTEDAVTCYGRPVPSGQRLTLRARITIANPNSGIKNIVEQHQWYHVGGGTTEDHTRQHRPIASRYLPLRDQGYQSGPQDMAASSSPDRTPQARQKTFLDTDPPFDPRGQVLTRKSGSFKVSSTKKSGLPTIKETLRPVLSDPTSLGLYG